MKGQAALEYLIVLGIALVVATPFVVKAQSSIVDIRSSVGSIQVQDSLNDIDIAIRTVSASGEPAARTIEARFPDNLNNTEVNQKSIVAVLNTPSGTKQLSRGFEANLTGELPDSGGLYLIKVQATGDAVSIEVVS